MTLISKTDIEAAYRNIRKDIVCTPLLYSQKLSRLCGCRVLLKLENFQLTGAFKERGALDKLRAYPPSRKEKGSWPPPRGTTPRPWPKEPGIFVRISADSDSNAEFELRPEPC